jgi:hypothetical protein
MLNLPKLDSSLIWQKALEKEALECLSNNTAVTQAPLFRISWQILWIILITVSFISSLPRLSEKQQLRNTY